jgi:hypothetical protein
MTQMLAQDDPLVCLFSDFPTMSDRHKAALDRYLDNEGYVDVESGRAVGASTCFGPSYATAAPSRSPHRRALSRWANTLTKSYNQCLTTPLGIVW